LGNELAAVGVEPVAVNFNIDAAEDLAVVGDDRLGANDSIPRHALALDINLALGLTLGVAEKFNTGDDSAVDIDLAIKDDSTVCFTAWTLAAVGVNDSIRSCKRQQLDLTAMTFESTLEGPVALAGEREGLDTNIWQDALTLDVMDANSWQDALTVCLGTISCTEQSRKQLATSANTLVSTDSTTARTRKQSSRQQTLGVVDSTAPRARLGLTDVRTRQQRLGVNELVSSNGLSATG